MSIRPHLRVFCGLAGPGKVSPCQALRFFPTSGDASNIRIVVHHYIKPCFTVLRIDFFHFNSSAGSFYKDEKVATTAEFEIVSSEIP